MDLTQYYSLKKPGPQDYVNVADFNENADALDAALHGLELRKADLDLANLAHLTDPQAALANLGAQPGRNLLDNWYFPTAINQRSWTTTYSTSGAYMIDRWLLTSGTYVVGSCTFTPSAQGGGITQRIEAPQALGGQTVTLSALLTSQGAIGLNINGTAATLDSAGGLVSHTVTLPASLSSLYVSITCANSERYPFTIRAAKLEVGGTQSLARQGEEGGWLLLDPLSHRAVEMLKCQRYLQVCWGDVNRSAEHAFDYRPPMRAVPRQSTADVNSQTWTIYDANL